MKNANETAGRQVEVKGLYKTNGITVKLHAADCGMLRTASPRNVLLETAEEVEDARERGFNIVECRCLKGRR